MMAEPMMAPSAMPAIFAACSGVEMPKPMAQGVLVFSRTHLHDGGKVGLDLAAGAGDAEAGHDIQKTLRFNGLVY